MTYFIHGFFFQRRTALGVAMGNAGEGVVATLQPVTGVYMFAGTIYKDVRGVKCNGQMQDYFGISALTHIHLYPDAISFRKHYNGRDDHVDYEFTRQGNIWVGEFSGPMTGRGSAKCILTEVPDNMCDPSA